MGEQGQERLRAVKLQEGADTAKGDSRGGQPTG